MEPALISKRQKPLKTWTSIRKKNNVNISIHQFISIITGIVIVNFCQNQFKHLNVFAKKNRQL